MGDVAFAQLTEQALSLSYDQTLILIMKMLENLKSKKTAEWDKEMDDAVVQSSMNTMWEELKDDAWGDLAY